MKRSTLIMLLSIVLAIALGVGGTMAYLQDTDEDVNVMALGNVYIEQHEMKRAEGVAHNATAQRADNTLVEFEEWKSIYPAVPVNNAATDYSAEQTDLFLWGDYVTADNDQNQAGNGLWNDEKLKGTMDKFVFVENTGKSDAYFRTWLAYECPEGITIGEPALGAEIMVNVNTGYEGWNEFLGFDTIEVDGEEIRFAIMCMTYAREDGVLPAGETARPSLLQVTLTHNATNEDMELLGGTYEVLAFSQACQTAGFSDKNSALNEVFNGAPSIDNHPWKDYAVERPENLNPDNGTTPKEGEVYDTEEIKYTYKAEWGGWHASTSGKDKTRTSYTLLESINGVPVTNLTTTFSGCTALVEAPAIPSGVTTMYQTFKGCTSLVNAPELPEGLTNMYYTFEGCSSLESAPEIPSTVTNMTRTFTNCVSMVNGPAAIPSSVTTLSYAFNNCVKLEATPDLTGATSLTNMEGTFNGCTSLVSASAIPGSVENMSKAFQNCSSLVVMPALSEGVANMGYTFSGCSELATATTIPATVTNMNCTFNNCPALSGVVTIDANPTSYANCFALSSVGKDITLTGSSSLLSKIAGYQKYRTIIIQ